jgi:hypothetical protein
MDIHTESQALRLLARIADALEGIQKSLSRMEPLDAVLAAELMRK